MKKQQLSKFKLLLESLIERMKENKDFFMEINFYLKSGTKEFKGSIKPFEELYHYHILGNTLKIDISMIAEQLVNDFGSYEEIRLEYTERGQKIIIEADDRVCKMRNEELKGTVKNDDVHADEFKGGKRDYLITLDNAKELLQEIGIVASNGKVKNDMIRKYNQIDHFVELLKPILIEISENRDSISVLDCACGKSYLSFVLNHFIKECLKIKCNFVGLDYSENVIKSSKEIANSLNYRNMEFEKNEIKNYKPRSKINFVISLHACDTATDEAIAFGINNDVDVITVVPCCQKEVLSQLKADDQNPIMKHGALRAKYAGILTDALRAMLLEAYGYEVKVIEYISPLETPKNIMILATKKTGINKEIMKKYLEIKQQEGIEISLEKFVITK